MFNTLGNFAVNSCWTFLDFARSRTLQLIGQTIQWNLDDPIHSTGGTHRYWDFEIKEWLETDLLKPLHWEFLTPTILPQGNYKDLITFRTKPFDLLKFRCLH